MKLASKSKNRIAILEMLQDGITTSKIYETIDYKNQSEDEIKKFIYQHLLERITSWVVEKKGFSLVLAKQRARTMITWEGNTKTTVEDINFMGTKNRPYITINIEGIKIAIEFKKGDRGNTLRDSFGQSLVYSTAHDFVLYLFIDTSVNEKIKNGAKSITEHKFLESIWNNFNIKFIIA